MYGNIKNILQMMQLTKNQNDYLLLGFVSKESNIKIKFAKHFDLTLYFIWGIAYKKSV